ncbi:hypothetical protein ACEQPO_04290 [Bacillus sp. SL00103]
MPSGLVPLGDQHAFRVDQGESHLQDMLYFLTSGAKRSSFSHT